MGYTDTYSPEVVDQNVEYAEDDHEQCCAPLGLESHHNHDTCDEANDGHQHPSDRPRSTEDEANEEEDEQHATSKLEVHLAVLLLNFWKTSKNLGLAHPGVGEHHEKTAHDRQVAQEEIDVEDETVAESLGDDDSAQTTNSVFGVFAGNDERGAGDHGDHVDNEEKVGDTAGN